MVQPGLEPFSTSNKTGEESEVEQPGPRGKKKNNPQIISILSSNGKQRGSSQCYGHSAIVSRAGELIPLIYLRRVNSLPKPVLVSR